jgi:hypothetical protein
MRRRALVLIVITLAPTTFGCHGELTVTDEPRLLRDSPGKPMRRTELSFGLARRGGGVVTDEEWRSFLRDEVTPRFPNGLTVIDTQGQWRGPDQKLVEEPSRVVIVLYDPSDRTASRRIEEIRVLYKSRFDQDSVMRADSVERLSF